MKQDVNLDVGNSFSAFAHRINQGSYFNSPFVTVKESEIGGFRSSKGYRLQGLPVDIWNTAGMDGIGTKVLISDAAKMYETSAADLVAMVCGDITRKGGLPLIMMNVLNVASLDTHEYITAAQQLMRGLGEYAKQQHLVLFNGETAELKGLGLADSAPQFSYLWESAGIGVFRESTEITGASIRPGQTIIAFQDKSPGSNGITELRRGLAKMHGTEWWNNPDAVSDIAAAAMPCTLYDRFLTHLNGWYNNDFVPTIKVHGIAHISGGGIPDKLAGDLLFSQGYGADLDNLFDPPAIFQKVAKAREIDFSTMKNRDYLKRLYDMWHGGQRLLVIVDEQDVDLCLQIAVKHNLVAQIAGVVTDTPVLKIKSKYELYNDFEILFDSDDLVRI
ncbi:MAG: AIR synthase-related protein [bacterium]